MRGQRSGRDQSSSPPRFELGLEGRSLALISAGCAALTFLSYFSHARIGHSVYPLWMVFAMDAGIAAAGGLAIALAPEEREEPSATPAGMGSPTVMVDRSRWEALNLEVHRLRSSTSASSVSAPALWDENAPATPPVVTAGAASAALPEWSEEEAGPVDQRTAYEPEREPLPAESRPPVPAVPTSWPGAPPEGFRAPPVGPFPPGLMGGPVAPLGTTAPGAERPERAPTRAAAPLEASVNELVAELGTLSATVPRPAPEVVQPTLPSTIARIQGKCTTCARQLDAETEATACESCSTPLCGDCGKASVRKRGIPLCLECSRVFDHPELWFDRTGAEGEPS